MQSVDNFALDALASEKGGFNFDNCRRNEILKLDVRSHAKKTGTTICGVVFNGGVAIAADTRSTSGSIICDKNCEKLHYISKLIYCAGAGTAADTMATTEHLASSLELLRLSTGKEPRVVAAMTRLKQYLFKYQGHVSAALVLGGIDETGTYLYNIHPHGSVDKLPFTSMGSGSLAAMAILEAGYHDNLTEEEAIELVSNAIKAGIFNDLGSGGNVDVCVMNRNTMTSRLLRNIECPIPNLPRTHDGYSFPRGTTEFLSETKTLFKNKIEVVTVGENNDMTD